MIVRGLIGAIGDVFANNLSVNPFAIDPAQAVYTITFVCILLFLLLVGSTYMYQQQVRDYKDFEDEFVAKLSAEGLKIYTRICRSSSTH